jgi:hypothetical protein
MPIEVLLRASNVLSATLPQVELRLRSGLDSDPVVHGRSDPLRTTEVTLGGLDGDMTEQKLNLLQFASGRPT